MAKRLSTGFHSRRGVFMEKLLHLPLAPASGIQRFHDAHHRMHPCFELCYIARCLRGTLAAKGLHVKARGSMGNVNIKVIGVGGGGCNAVSHMMRSRIKD